MDSIKRIQDWYTNNCNGDWEHSFGVKLETLDNPGWSVEVDLTSTAFESKDFNEVKHNCEKDADWYRCWVENKKWNGVGGSQNLQDILKKFLDWAV